MQESKVTNARGPIGMFDSGIGGGTVLRHVHRLLPAEDILYLADQAHVPYGPRPREEIRLLAQAATEWLLAQGAKVIVVACNTASAAALRWLRREYPNVPFVGMVPAVKPAARQSKSGVVGLMATPATMQGELLQEVVQEWAQGVQLVQQVCHGLVEHIEKGELDSPETLALLRTYLTPMLNANADHIVLGCTHYPYLEALIRRVVGPTVHLVDAGEAVARQVARVLDEHHLRHPGTPRNGHITYATTGDVAHLATLVERLHLPAGAVQSATYAVSCA